MAIKRKLQVRYGAAASRPTLATGEFGLDSGTGVEKLWIGTPAGNAFVGPLNTSGEVKRYVATVSFSSGSLVSGFPKTKLNTTGTTPTFSMAGSPPYGITGFQVDGSTETNTNVLITQKVSSAYVAAANGTSDGTITFYAVDLAGSPTNTCRFDVDITIYP